MAHGGIGIFDGDLKQNFSIMLPQSTLKLNFGGNIEYTFNPAWGMYIDYLYNPYAGTARFEYKDYFLEGNPVNFKGVSHNFTLGLSLNMLNLFYHCRPQKWQWYVNVGGGADFYKILEHPKLDELKELRAQGIPISEIDSKYKIISTWDKNLNGVNGSVFSVPIGTTVEWNATRWLAVLLHAQFRMRLGGSSGGDAFDLSIYGSSGDNIAYAGLGLRWKINSLAHRNLYHVRDMAMCQYEQNMASSAVKKLGTKIDSLDNKVDSLDKKVNDLVPRIKALEEDMDKLRDTDEDGVPDIRDRHPNTPPNTVVNYWGEPIYDYDGNPIPLDEQAPYGAGAAGAVYNPATGTYQAAGGAGAYNPGTYNRPTGGGYKHAGGAGAYNPATGEGYVIETECSGKESVYFATSKFNLTLISHTTLATVARKMYACPEATLEIHGYCDEQGQRTQYDNRRLSKNRAKNVKETLVKKYGVDAKRILVIEGHGAIQGPTIDYLPNRRVDVLMNK
jgi:outer membrane protein OmpA-like peptidoglycan-associated protein/outer membrane murein-binding lipoprotein Lpp